MFDKLLEAKKNAEESKKRLDAITVVGEAESGKVRVVATGNREIKEISFDDELFTDLDREGVEELLLVAVNHALQQAEKINQSEMQAMTENMLGGMGGLGALGNLFGGK